jgi:hypothetical protein
MKRFLYLLLIVSAMISWVVFGALARKVSDHRSPANYQKHVENPGSDRPLDAGRLHMNAVVDTYVVARFTFDGPAGPDPQGWFGIDLTEQEGLYFHIDDFASLNGGDFGGLVPLQGDQSLWCGAKPDAGDTYLCNYAKLPGYGNGWDQRFESVEFALSGDVTLEFLVRYDSEPGYDYTYVQYQNKNDQWITILTLDDVGDLSVNEIIPEDSLDGTVKVRFRFRSDGAWSDQDGLWNTDGGVIIDSISISDTTGVLDYHDFEMEAVGETSTWDGDWTAQVRPGFGYYVGLFPGTSTLQEDPCKRNTSFLWGFFNGSTDDYGCGGHPEQLVVPHGREIEGEMVYLHSEIWSPLIDWHHDIHGTPIPSTAERAIYEFDVYRNLPLNALVFYFYHLRSWVDGCPRGWRDRAFANYGGGPDWIRLRESFGDLVSPNIEQLQLALMALDMCGYWCIVYGTGNCHSHSPLFDNVEILRFHYNGPQWSARDIDLFQDTFPENGTSVGTGRIDMALDRLPSSSPGIMPGDSAKVLVSDPTSGLREPDPNTGFGPAVYFYMHRDPGSKPMPLDKIVENSFRWPLVDSVTCNNKDWYIFRMDTCFTEPAGPRTGPVPDAYCIDINDHYFTNGDTIWFFFGAENSVGEWTYFSHKIETLGQYYYAPAFFVVSALEEVCANPMEMQILPGEGVANGGDFLYVDNFSGRGAQPYFDSAFEIIGIDDEIDRFDKRGPSSLVGNALGYHASLLQLHTNYRGIIWNSGDLSVGTVGDGTSEKADDYALLFAFLDLHPNPNGGGIYFSGDDLAQELNGMTTMSSQQFKNVYMPHTLITGDHSTLLSLSPMGIGEGAGTGIPPSVGLFDHGPPEGMDTIVVYGGCPILTDFDVIAPVGSATIEMCYDPANEDDDTNPAVIKFDTLNSLGNRVATVLSGFSVHNIRDDRPQGIPDLADHLWDILTYVPGGLLPEPVTVTPDLQYVNDLSQNFPNPFNPSTTIKYSIKERGHVSLKIYNVAGQLVRTLASREMKPGAHKETWNGVSNAGTPVSSGVYFYKLTAKDYSETKKMVMLK